MTTRQWQNITDYMDTVGTTLKTFTFPKTQNYVNVTIRGNANVSYTIGSQSGTLTPGQSIGVSEKITSFTLTAASGTQAVEVWATEDGTQKVEDDSSDSIAGLASSMAANTQRLSNIHVDVVKDFNAKCDGTTDDTTAIQSALDSLTNGGTVFIPKSAVVSSLKVNYDNITIEGKANITTLSSTLNGVVIDIRGRNNITIKNLGVSNLTSNTGARLISLGNTTNVLLDKLTLQNAGNVGVVSEGGMTVSKLTIRNSYFNIGGDFGFSCQGGSDIKIVSNTFTNNVQVNYPPHAIYLEFGVKDSIISENYITNVQNSGIELSDGNTSTQVQNVVVSNNRIDNCTYGVKLAGTIGCSVTGNVITNVANNGGGIITAYTNDKAIISGNNVTSSNGYGVYIQNGTPQTATNFQITANYFDCAQGAVLFSNAKGITFSGNTCKSNGNTTGYTIYTQTNCVDISIINNKIEKGDRAIMCDQTTYLTIAHNVITNNPNNNSSYSIRVTSSCGYVMVNGNNLMNCTGLFSIECTNASITNNVPLISSYSSVANNGTINTTGLSLVRTGGSGGAVTGIILQAGIYGGQEVTLVNESVNSITFASSGSNIADGSSDVINATTARKFVWDSGTSLWYRIQ